jgi:two-component system response regulator NreC
MSPVTRPRVLIADATPVAEEYSRLLEPEFEVIGIVGDEKALLESVPELKPDVLILDTGISGMTGMVASKRIKKLMRTVRIVYLTASANSSFAAEALRGGAAAYLLKTSATGELVTGVREVLKGKQYVSPSIKDEVKELSSTPADSHRGNEKLTERQREVLKLLAEGRTMKEIAYILILTPRTVAFHKYMMMERLHLRTNADLIQYAIQEQVITPRS